MKVSANQWHNYGSVHLAIFDHLWVFEIMSGLNSVERTNSEEADRGGGRISEKREKRAMITLIELSKVNSSNMNNISLHTS